MKNTKDARAEITRIMSRREMLGFVGATSMVMLTGCGGGGGGSSASGTTSTGTVTPEGEIGPYFADDSASGFLRSNILTNIDGTSAQTGVRLTLNIYVYDSENNGEALAGAQIDIWHCNALGVYSDEAVESTSGQTYLRGYQLTDASGLVTFQTIIPGWYQGRATHIHLRVRSKYSEASSPNDGSNTTQIFFPQATLDSIYTSVSPYNTKGIDTTTNSNDHVYTPETQGETEVVLNGDSTNGYAAAFSIHLPITSV